MSLKNASNGLFLGLAMIGFGVMASSCGPSAGSYCNKLCDCTDCTESERSDCVGQVSDAREESSSKGCASEFSAYFSCVNSAAECVASKVHVTGCDAESEALSRCGGPVTLGTNACDQLAITIQDKFTECGLQLPDQPPDSTECTPDLAKVSACYLPCYKAVDCLVLTDPTNPQAAGPTKTFSDCVAACAQ